MYYFYVLESALDKSLYFGSTDNLKRRLQEHNNGEARYTKNRKPWTLIYYEAHTELKKARFREWKIKNSAHEYRKLKDRI